MGVTSTFHWIHTDSRKRRRFITAVGFDFDNLFDLLEHKVDRQLGVSIFDLKLILQYALHQWYCDLSANSGYYTFD